MRVMTSLPASTNSDDALYTVPEAAALLAVSQSTVWRWIVAGQLRAHRIGPRRIRIRKQDLVAVVRPVGAKEATMADAPESRDIWANYDPQRVRQALRQSAGALAGVDRDALWADIRAARRQASHGRQA